MRTLLFLCLCGVLLAGCMQSVSATMGDHVVFARSAPTSHASVVGNDVMTVVTLGQKSLTVTPAQATWRSGRSVMLPDGWKKLEVAELYTNLIVIVDGQVLREPSSKNPLP